ncbi:hypothetical protein HanPSC8_Chr14g0621481 [Helianthus annuus]|nr:hypothetical protein HanPSC8_Chr14g0621481 [Helianthus annuus]
MHEVDDVRTDGGFHDVREGEGGSVGGHVGFKWLDGDERTSGGGHCCGLQVCRVRVWF